MSRSAARKLPKPTTMSVAELRAALPDVLRRAERGEEIEVTRRGVPVAVVHAIRSDGASGSPLRLEATRVARLRRLIDRMAADPILREGEDPWADVRDPSPGRPPPTFE